MSNKTKNIIYFSVATFLMIIYPAMLTFLPVPRMPFFVFIPAFVGFVMIGVKGVSIWYRYVTHQTERTKDLDYPDPTIIDITGIKYREDPPSKENS
jgi:membrane protein implicated in regulation of membrane protease activity